MARLNQETEAFDGLGQKEGGKINEGEDEERLGLGCCKDFGVSTVIIQQIKQIFGWVP